jgi:hypothetical protein
MKCFERGKRIVVQKNNISNNDLIIEELVPVK